MRKFIMSITTVASLSLAAVPILGLTQAANAAEPTARVIYGDLNMADPAQAKIFDARVERAGLELCRSMMRSGDLAMPVRACVANAHREADMQVARAQHQAQIRSAQAKTVEVAAK